ncbi:MAG: fumarylacetoacetate hydrolase family protein, partial [Gaiellaceae bacterium]|nr:fumarylacetoacetate hydrolase family protein [Gaiellaceae bacterium]
VVLLPPLLQPPAVRIFEDERTFAFANPAAIVGPGASIAPPGEALPGRERRGPLRVRPRLAAVIGQGSEIAGFTILCEWRAPGLRSPKDRDFALGLGPVVVTSEELGRAALAARVAIDGAERLAGGFDAFDWEAARAWAAAGTTLRAGDLLAGPALGEVAVPAGSEVGIDVSGVGLLVQRAAEA